MARDRKTDQDCRRKGGGITHRDRGRWTLLSPQNMILPSTRAALDATKKTSKKKRKAKKPATEDPKP